MNNVITRICLLVIFMTFFFYSCPIMAKKKKVRPHTIESVEAIEVKCPVGTAPRLPFQVMVTYSDGKKEWRQTRWTNSSTSTEQQQANAELNPVGKQYKVLGFVIGDYTTEQGYPITAQVQVVDHEFIPSNKPIATPLPLGDVRLTGQNRLTHNRSLDVQALLQIDYRQMLYNYRDTYGLPTDGYPVADGWDSPTTKLKGHGTGHYLSALAFAYATESDEYADNKAQLLSRIKNMVNAMRECQERTFVFDEKLGRYREARDYAPEAELLQMKGNWKAFDQYKCDYQHYGYGYMNAIPAAHPALIECYRAYNNEDWVWAPYYTIHKQLAGLIDIANNVDDKEVADKALLIAKDMGLWVWNRLHYRTYVKSDGTKQERQATPGNRYEMWNMYIAGEVGGMEESLARLSTMVSDATEKARLLEAASYFDAPAFFDPVTRNIDDVRTRHANQHIPMIVGALRNYMAGGDANYFNLARNFWNMMQGRYVYAMGGVGNGEMFRQPYSQMLSMNTNVQSDRHRQMHPNPDLNETCCAYNLAKLTKDLNMLTPDDATLMDYYERVLMNQIVGSINPNEYGCTYQYAVGMNARKPFGNETPQSSCCGGTGAENHVKYQEAAYFVNDNTMWVALYMPTEAVWSQKHITVTQECQWPSEHSTFRFKNHNGGKARFALKLRIPYWATSIGTSIYLNEKKIASIDPQKNTAQLTPCSYYEIAEREWSDDDVVSIRLPYTTHLNFGPDKMDVAAVEGNPRQSFDPAWLGTVMYGPLAMATPHVKEWSHADFHINETLNNISRELDDETDGTGGPLYKLTMYDVPNYHSNQDQPRPFTIDLTPDYYQTDHSTHYLRLHVRGSAVRNDRQQLAINQQMLSVAIETAMERKNEQEAWHALAVKVPEFAPWAPYGYQRLMAEMQKAEQISKMKSPTSKQISEMVSSLNVAINTKRPGNLAEPEDLAELLPLLENAKNAEKTPALQEAINYANMVVQYVNDGSGTHDMINKAIKGLK